MLFPETNTTVAVRFTFFLLQIVAMVTMSILLAMAPLQAVRQLPRYTLRVLTNCQEKFPKSLARSLK